MAWFHLSQWLACTFCNTSRATHHQLCQYCWESLSWDLTSQTRQDVQFIASCYYNYPMDRVIHYFKDQAQLHYLPLLHACLLQIPKPQVQAIVPMPISTEKLIQRGFSQTYLLATALSKYWNLPIWQPIARHHGQDQRGLDRELRLHNLIDKFYPCPKNNQSYRNILMLDDVITTGASLFSLQQQLLQLGCTKIQALCLCNATTQ